MSTYKYEYFYEQNTCKQTDTNHRLNCLKIIMNCIVLLLAAPQGNDCLQPTNNSHSTDQLLYCYGYSYNSYHSTKFLLHQIQQQITTNRKHWRATNTTVKQSNYDIQRKAPKRRAMRPQINVENTKRTIQALPQYFTDRVRYSSVAFFSSKRPNHNCDHEKFTNTTVKQSNYNIQCEAPKRRATRPPIKVENTTRTIQALPRYFTIRVRYSSVAFNTQANAPTTIAITSNFYQSIVITSTNTQSKTPTRPTFQQQY